MGPKRRRRGVGGAPLTPIRYINVNFPPSDRELYDWIKAKADERRQGASQYLRCLADDAKAAEEAELALEAEASDGSGA